MPRQHVELLLTENVESLGIVGDVVKVKPGYARNYLLPHGYATIPTDRAKAALAERRAQVQAQLEALRRDMEALVEKLENAEVTIEVSCNDHGFLYGSVTQLDIAEALNATGFPQVRDRHVRLGQAIKRIDSYMVPVQLDQDLRTEVKVWVVADRELAFAPTDSGEQMDTEATLIEEAVEATTEAEPGEEGTSESPADDSTKVETA